MDSVLQRRLFRDQAVRMQAGGYVNPAMRAMPGTLPDDMVLEELTPMTGLNALSTPEQWRARQEARDAERAAAQEARLAGRTSPRGQGARTRGIADVAPRQERVAEFVRTSDTPMDFVDIEAALAEPMPAAAPAVEAPAVTAPEAQAAMQTEEDRILEAFNRREALYASLLGDKEERRRDARARVLLDVAQRAAMFAGGVGPDGQPMRGSMAAQAAQAFGPTFGTIAEEAGRLTEEDRAVRLARLQASEREVEREQDFENQVRLLTLKAMLEGAGQQVTPLVDPDAVPGEDERLGAWREDLDVRSAFGTGAKFRGWLNTIAGAVGAPPPARMTEDTMASVTAFNNSLIAPLGRDVSDTGRLSNLVIELSRGLLPEPGEIRTSPYRAISRYEAILGRFDDVADQIRAEYNDPATSAKRREELLPEYHLTMRRRADLGAFVGQLSGRADGSDAASQERVRQFMQTPAGE